MSSSSKRCAFCGAPATLLCDYELGRLAGVSLVADADDRNRVYRAGETITCDTPLCERCAKRRSVVFIKTRGRSYRDTVDHCPDHIDRPFRGEPIMVSDIGALREARREEIAEIRAGRKNNG